MNCNSKMSIAYLPVNEDFRAEAKNTIKFDFMKQRFNTKENSIIVDRYVKMFDKRFLHFITQRQQRDLVILQYAMQFLLQQAEYNKKTFQCLQMSQAFNIENKHILVNDGVVPIDWKLNVLHLEQEISIMKTIHSFMQNTINKHANYCDEKTAKSLAGIDAKMEKIKRLYNKKNPIPRHKGLLGKHLELDSHILKDVDYAFALAKRIYECGGVIHEHCTGSGAVVFDVESADELNEHLVEKTKKRGLEVMTLGQLEQMLG